MGNDSLIASNVKVAHAIESGRYVARDIGGSDPERTAALRIAEYAALDLTSCPLCCG